jgi:hypothetical protein
MSTEQGINRDEKAILSTIDLISRTWLRYKDIRNPLLKYSLICDNFITIFDTFLEYVTNSLQNPNSNEVQIKIANLRKVFTDEMMGLMKFIESHHSSTSDPNRSQKIERSENHYPISQEDNERDKKVYVDVSQGEAFRKKYELKSAEDRAERGSIVEDAQCQVYPFSLQSPWIPE